MAEKPEKGAKQDRPDEPKKGGKPEEPKRGAKPEGAEAPKEGKGKKDGKEGKEGKEKAPPKKEVVRSDNPDFRYIVRIANTDLNGNHPVEIALAAVRGIGIRTAGVIADITGINRYERIGNLNEAQTQQLEAAVNGLAETVPPWLVNRAKDLDTGRHLHLVSTDVETRLRDDLNRMRKIRSYKGVRHETGQKVRGQRSRSNGRTGLTVGVQRKDVKQAAAGGAKDEGKKEEKKEAAKPAAGAAKPAAGAAKPAGGKPEAKK